MSNVARAVRRSAVVAAVGAALVLSGCTATAPDGTATEGPSEPLVVWFPGNNQTEIDLVTDTIAPAFEEETGVDVEVTFVDWGDLSTKLNAAFAAGTAPDVFGHGGAAVADLVANDRIVDLTDRLDALSPEDQEDLGDALNSGEVGGKQYSIPLGRNGNLIMYNAEDLADAGLDPDDPPATWEQLKTAAEKLTVRDASGTITRSGLLLASQTIARQQTFQTLLTSAGGTALNDAETEAAWDSAEGTKALEYFASLYNGHDAVAANLGEDYSNAPAAQQPLVLGTAAMTLLGTAKANEVKAAAPDKDLRIMQPLGFKGNDPAAQGGANLRLMINSDTKQEEAAWTFLSYMLDPEIDLQYAEGLGLIPLRESAIDSDYVKENPVIQAFLEASPYYTAGNPNVPGWVQIRDVLDVHLEQALHEVATPEDALAAAAGEADAILKANG